MGCNATATTLAVWPLAAAGLIDTARGIICEVKVGSSEGGAASTDSTHHPERAGVLRSFAPTGHRHTAEVLQALQVKDVVTEVHLSATAVDNVRGVLATAHVFVKPGTAEKDVWKAYRETYNNEPFVRIVKERRACIDTRSRRFSRGATTPMSASRWIRTQAASSRSARSTT